MSCTLALASGMFPYRNSWIPLLTASLLGFTVLTAASEEELLQRQLDHAARLNLTAPWPESQAILDQIEPQLDQATPDQFAAFQLLQIRNLALAGNLADGLELTRQLLEYPIPPEQRLSALARGANLGVVARRFEEAFDYLYQSLEIEPEVGQPELTTYVYSMAADIFRTVGKVDRAIDYAQRSVEVAREHGHVRAECVARMRLSAAYRAADRLSEAQKHYRKTLDQCRLADDPIYFGIAEYGLGDTLQRKGRLAEAEQHITNALAQHSKNGFASGEAETRLALAQLYLSTDRTQQGADILAELTSEFTNSGRWDYLAITHQLLGEIASERGDYAEALHHALEQIDARERFLDVERARQLAYLEIEFETRFKEQELALLREQQRVSELQEQTRLQQRRLHTMAYASGGFLTLILILLLIHARRERRHYQRLSHLDSLTGLSNHTRFFDTARLMVREARNNGTALVLIMGDIDHFKQVNDVHGHLVGDEALRQVAKALKETFADRGLVGRIGGEEFAACLTNEGLDDAQRALETLRGRLRAVDYGDNGRALTMSFGLARLQPGERLERLRQRADLALYQAKNAGRDTIVLAAEDG